MTHTQTPWQLLYPDGGTITGGAGDRETVVCEMFPPREDLSTPENPSVTADRKFLLLAANSHEDLVAALRIIADKITPRMRTHLQEDWAYEEITITNTDLSAIDAALAKATKELA